MSFRKRKSPTPAFKMPPPYDPFIGQTAGLPGAKDLTRVALFQVIEEDTHDNYLVCRGFDPETKRLYDSINIAKPYAVRGENHYSIAEIICCAKPLTRLGINSGRAESTIGQPTYLDEEIVLLLDDDENPINWMEIGGAGAEVSQEKFYNDSGETIPAYALMPVTGVHIVVDGEGNPIETILKVDKPGTTFYWRYIVNDENAVEADGTGYYQNTETVRVRYAWNQLVGYPGTGWGPAPDSWYATLLYPAVCICAGPVDSYTMLAKLVTLDIFIGRTTTTLEKDTWATVEVYHGEPGAEVVIENGASQTMSIAAWSWMLDEIDIVPLGTKVVCEYINGVWYVTGAEC